MEKTKNLYETIGKDAKSGKQAYSLVNEYIENFIIETLRNKNISSEKTIEDINDKIFEYFDDFGNLSEEKALKLVSNIIENELIILEHNIQQDKEMFENSN